MVAKKKITASGVIVCLQLCAPHFYTLLIVQSASVAENTSLEDTITIIGNIITIIIIIH